MERLGGRPQLERRLGAGFAIAWLGLPLAYVVEAWLTGTELSVATPAAVCAVPSVALALWIWARRRGLRLGSILARAGLVGLLGIAAFAWHTLESSVLHSVRPGTEFSHLALFLATWGVAGAAALVAGAALRPMDRGGAPPLLRRVAAATGIALGLALLEADQRLLVDQREELHLWLAFQGTALLAAGLHVALRSRLTTRRLGFERSAGVVLALVVVGAGVNLARYTDRTARNGLDESALGTSVLELVPSKRKPRLLVGLGFSPRELDYPQFLARPSPIEKPNILLISVDALRGDAWKHAPRMSEFAEKAWRFDTAYAQGPRTAMGMSAILTGRYSANTDWELWIYNAGQMMRKEDLTETQKKKWKRKHVYTTVPVVPEGDFLAERLDAAGYSTAAIPFAGVNDFFARGVGFERGFDSYVDLTRRSPIATPSSNTLADRALKRIERLEKSDRPWFMWVHFFDPHESEGKRRRYRQLVGEYDAAFARLIEHLEESGSLSNTVIAVVADHGEALGEHGHVSHATALYEAQVRVPLMVYVPGMEGARIEDPVATVDLTATLAVLAGAHTERLDGVNLIPLGSGDPDAKGQRPVFTELHRYASSKGRRTSDMKAIRLGPWKLIDNRKKGTVALYDVVSDPRERKNLLETEPQVARRLGLVLDYFIAQGEREHPLP